MRCTDYKIIHAINRRLQSHDNTNLYFESKIAVRLTVILNDWESHAKRFKMSTNKPKNLNKTSKCISLEIRPRKILKKCIIDNEMCIIQMNRNKY